MKYANLYLQCRCVGLPAAASVAAPAQAFPGKPVRVERPGLSRADL